MCMQIEDLIMENLLLLLNEKGRPSKKTSYLVNKLIFKIFKFLNFFIFKPSHPQPNLALNLSDLPSLLFSSLSLSIMLRMYLITSSLGDRHLSKHNKVMMKVCYCISIYPIFSDSSGCQDWTDRVDVAGERGDGVGHGDLHLWDRGGHGQPHHPQSLPAGPRWVKAGHETRCSWILQLKYVTIWTRPQQDIILIKCFFRS